MVEWQVKVIKKCSEMNIDVEDGNTLVCPKPLDFASKKQILELMPAEIQTKIVFKVGPKSSTLNSLQSFLAQVGGAFSSIHGDGSDIKIILGGAGHGGRGYDEIDWSPISGLLSKDGFFESWSVIVNDKTVLYFNTKVAKDMEINQTKRETVIQNSDLIDLKILLNTEMDFDKLIARL